MANKHIINPCSLSGEIVPPNTEIPYYLYPNANTVRVLCPECHNLVSVNKTNKRFRKHTGDDPISNPDSFGLVHDFE